MLLVLLVLQALQEAARLILMHWDVIVAQGN
jgi:hypothetical protein